MSTVAAKVSQRTEHALIASLALVRLAQHAPFLVVAVASRTTYAETPLVFALFGVSIAWSSTLFYVGLRRNRIGPWWVATDVAFYSVVTIVVGRLALENHALTGDNWTVGPACGAAIVAAIFAAPRFAAIAIPVVGASYVIGVLPDATTIAAAGTATGNALSVVAFAVAGGLVGTSMRRSSARAEEALTNEFAVRLDREKTRARFHERTRQYRLLHDTVLSTLSAVARGGLDHRAPEVQKRCADDADFLRGLITGMSNDVPTSLGAALAEVARSHASIGLGVRQQFDGLPDSMPPEAVEAITHAVREALNNVAKHSGTVEAWLTATGEDHGAVRVTVADRGVGFARHKVSEGFGIRQSIEGRLSEAGGAAMVRSWRGEGTEVEILWPA